MPRKDKSQRKELKEGESCCLDEREASVKGSALVKDILENGSEYPLDTSPTLLPTYYNHDLVERGQKYYAENMFNMFVVKLSGLLAILAVPSILKILRLTNRSSEPATAYKRYLQTILQMVTWYESDLRNPNSRGRQSIEVVRKHHALASKSHGPITQKDMALTQFGFIGLALAAYDKLGLPKDQTALIHLWKVIGHMLGISERFNLCQGCDLCTKAACRELAEQFFGPSLDCPPEHFQEMTKALLEGLWPISPIMSPPAFVEHLRRLCNCPAKDLDLIPLFFLYWQTSVHKLLNVKLISILLAPILNFQIWLSLFFQKTMPILAFIKFGKNE